MFLKIQLNILIKQFKTKIENKRNFPLGLSFWRMVFNLCYINVFPNFISRND
jgi:hypothetical protein